MLGLRSSVKFISRFDSNDPRVFLALFLCTFFPPPFCFFVFCDGPTFGKKTKGKKREKTSLDKIHVINPTDETSSPVLRSAASFREEERTGERERETERERKRERRKEKARR